MAAQLWHAVYLNDNHYAYASEDFEAPDRGRALIIAGNRCPMGPCGLTQLYTAEDWKAKQAEWDEEENAYRELVQKERITRG